MPAGIPVAGVADSSAWFSFSFDEFLHEGDVSPDAMSFCAEPECPARLAIGSFSVAGQQAEQLERILARPELLAKELRRRKNIRSARKTGKPLPSTISVTADSYGPAYGFMIIMSGKGGKGRIAASVLGRKAGQKLHFVIAISNDENAAAKAARTAVTRLPAAHDDVTP